MALKTTNFELKEIGQVLDTAYALITSIRTYIDKKGIDKGKATVVIQKSREACKNLSPLYSFQFEFNVNRDENPYKTAYEILKAEPVAVEFKFNPRIKTKHITRGYCYGWEDDIV